MGRVTVAENPEAGEGVQPAEEHNFDTPASRTPWRPQEATEVEHSFGIRIVAWTRFIAVVPVLGLMLGSITLIISASIKTVTTVLNGVTGHYGSKDLLVSFIEVADIFLLGIVLYIISLGIFELFVDDRLPLPKWLEFHHLNDLEHKLIGVVAVVLTVYFLGQVIKTPTGEAMGLLWLGLSIGAVLAAVGFFMWAAASSEKH